VRMQPRPVEQLPDVDFASIERVVAAAFGQRRKTLRNALAALLNEAAIRAAGVDPGVRAETLPIGSFVALAKQAIAQMGTSDR